MRRTAIPMQRTLTDKRAARRRLKLAAIGLAALLVGAGAALAAIPGGGTVDACAKQNGSVRVIDASADRCKKNETAMAWAESPAPGPKGEAGARGQQGERGAQ